MPVLTRKKRITLVLLAVAAFLWVAQTAHRKLSQQQQTQQSEPASQGPLTTGMQMASDLTLIPITGEQKPITALKGKVMLINFWASWCTPCMHEMPALFALQKTYADRGLTILGYNMDDNPNVGVAMLLRVAGESPFPIFKGVNTPIADRFAIEGLPFTVIVDKNFKIVYAKAGEVDWGTPHAKKFVEGFL
jgi:thiol-disulfide isomerase/thioredoxin